jgi:hypothetical protein
LAYEFAQLGDNGRRLTASEKETIFNLRELEEA